MYNSDNGQGTKHSAQNKLQDLPYGLSLRGDEFDGKKREVPNNGKRRNLTREEPRCDYKQLSEDITAKTRENSFHLNGTGNLLPNLKQDIR